MSRRKLFLEIDVLEAARQRVRRILDEYDSFAVMFSGGKDSLVLLHLVRKVCAERGISRVPAIFYDEEVIHRSVIDFVSGYRGEPWLDLFWFCVPLPSDRYVLGTSHSYTQWDSNREWVRPMPSWAIRLEPGDARRFDQKTADTFFAEKAGLKGRVGILYGVRAEESIHRRRAAMKKLVDNWIFPTKDRRIVKAGPLYDWSEADIFRFLWERGIRYCPVYDAQLFAKANLRVSTALHAERAKKVGEIRRTDPELWERCLAIWPDIAAHDRYWNDLDRTRGLDEYGGDFDGVRRWVEENLEGERQVLASRLLEQAIRDAGRKPEDYPPRYVLRCLMNGALKRKILPLDLRLQERARKKYVPRSVRSSGR